MSSEPSEIEVVAGRSVARQYVAMLVIGAAVAQALGVAIKSPTQLEANDISRWCTVWSLLERGTYAIDACPWQARTQDKVLHADKIVSPDAPTDLLPGEPGKTGEKGWPLARHTRQAGKDVDHTDSGDKDLVTPADTSPPIPVGPSSLTRLEYQIAPRSWKADPALNDEPPTWHFYSSKPPLLPTMIAGALYPFRKVSGIPLEREILTDRAPRNVQKIDPDHPGEFKYELETPKEKIKWPVYVFYFKPIVVLLNIVPMLFFLIFYARLLDRLATNDWAWMASLFAGAWGTLLFAFDQTLNNHTVAAYSAFFALYATIKIYDDEAPSRRTFMAAGFWASFCACNELPAALFGVLLFACLLVRAPLRTLGFFVPVAAIPAIAFLATQYAAMGQFTPAYEDFGTAAYEYKGSMWQTPLEFDYLNKVPETKGVYLIHMLVGHHGVFSLTPILAFSIIGAFAAFTGRSRGLKVVAVQTLLLTIAMFAFYDWNPKARNYGGSTQGLRWLFWLIPFWMVTLPAGLAPGGSRPIYRGLSLVALMASVFSVGYALRHPWSHPWILDLMEQAGMYSLKR